MRWVVTEKLKNELTLIERYPFSIAIIGGSSKDPEVEIVKERFPKSTITYLGIDNYGNDVPWSYLDLNIDSTTTDQFDLIICSQVLEHVWNLNCAFKVISQLTKDSGHIWVNCPTSNMAHGSPDYFSAGYSPDYLRLNLEALDFKTMSVGSFGSKRYYKAVHHLRHWSTEAEHSHPLLGYRISGGITLGKLREMLSRLPGRILMSSWESQITSHIDFSTETYYFGRKALK